MKTRLIRKLEIKFSVVGIQRLPAFNTRCGYLLSAALRSNAADYVLRRFIFIFLFYFFFIHRSFSETTRPIHTKFPGIVYSSVD